MKLYGVKEGKIFNSIIIVVNVYQSTPNLPLYLRLKSFLMYHSRVTYNPS